MRRETANGMTGQAPEGSWVGVGLAFAVGGGVIAGDRKRKPGGAACLCTGGAGGLSTGERTAAPSRLRPLAGGQPARAVPPVCKRKLTVSLLSVWSRQT